MSKKAFQSALRLLSVLVVVGALTGCSGPDSSAYKPGTVERNAYDQPVWVTVKYRSTPVDVGTGGFEHWTNENPGNVREGWFDVRNDYMLLNLDGTVYHYCNVSIAWWRSLTSAKSADLQFDLYFKGSMIYDCRRYAVPSYP